MANTNNDPTSTPINRQRREKYAQNDEWTEAYLHQSEVGHVATRWENQPFITPTLFWFEAAKRVIYFHSNITGRVRANAERHPEVCFEASRMGRLLPSNVALEFSVQYESVVVFGRVRVVEDPAEQEAALYGLLNKYFPERQPGRDYRPIIPEELRRTSVYAIQIESWSGKRNWKEQAEQNPDWRPGDSH